MSLGDVPTWVAAVAAWAGVVVNALIVFVALSPIRTAQRERTARGRLVAAHLAFPMALAYATLTEGREDLKLLFQPCADSDAESAAIKRLSELPETVNGLLNRFDISEAAYLSDGMGEKLAQSIGAVNAAAMATPSVVNVFVTARKLDNIEPVKEGAAYREEAQKVCAAVMKIFSTAVERMGVFVDYCERLGLVRTMAER